MFLLILIKFVLKLVIMIFYRKCLSCHVSSFEITHLKFFENA